eukprot:6047847-Amphidinium_carterae.1
MDWLGSPLLCLVATVEAETLLSLVFDKWVVMTHKSDLGVCQASCCQCSRGLWPCSSIVPLQGPEVAGIGVSLGEPGLFTWWVDDVMWRELRANSKSCPY